MLFHMESALRPAINDFVLHVNTDPGDDEENWVARGLELSRSVHLSIVPVNLLGYEIRGLRPTLEKLWVHFVNCRARLEQNLEASLSPKQAHFHNFDVKTVGMQLDVQGLSPDTDVKSLLLESPICTIKSISSMLNVLSSPKGFTVTLPVISGYPMVYTLEAYRLLLNRFDGAVVQWHSPDAQRPSIALEIAVEGLRNGERDRYLLDTLITSELGAGYLIQSWLFHDTYHVFLSDPVAVDRVLGQSIPFGGLKFDLLYRLAIRRLRRAHPPTRGKHVELCHANGCQRYSLCLGDAMALEKDLYIIVTCYLTPEELNSFGPLSAEYYEDDVPHCVPQPSTTIPTLMWQVHNALYEGEWAQFEELVVQCNKLLNEAPLKEYAAKWKRCPDLMVTHQIQNLYRRCITQHLHTLRRNASLSGYSMKTLSYGAINSGLASRIFSHLNIKKAYTFWDLGCGSGSVLVQASLQTGCRCFGVELLPCRAKIAEEVVKEFESACKLWVLQAGKIIIMVGDLLSEEFWLGRIDAGDAILINNLVFEATLNHEIWKRLGSLKAGATVVTLEPFFEGHKRNGGSCVEFSVEEMQYDPGDVSWHAYGGSYYIYRKRMEAK